MILLLAALADAADVPELSLADAVRMVVERNPDRESAVLAESIAQIDAHRARLDRATLALGVSGDGAAGVQKPWNEDTIGVASADWDARARLTVPLYAGGAIQASIDRADAASRIATTDRTITERQLVRAAYTAYWTIRGYELQIAATEEGLALTQEGLDIISAKAKAGLAAGIDVNRSTVELYAQQDALVSEKSELYQSQQDLIRLLHLQGDAVVLTDVAPEPASGAVALPENAGEKRPELQRKDDEAAAAEAAIRAARSATLPSVSVFATAGAGGASAGPTDDSAFGAFTADDLRPALDASAGLQLSWNVFDLGKTHDSVAAAKLAAAQVDASALAEKDSIAADIRQAAARVRELRERVPLSDKQVALARDNLQIVRDLYAQGSATVLELFDAQSAFRSASTQGASLRVQLATAECDLRWLLGDDPLGAPR